MNHCTDVISAVNNTEIVFLWRKISHFLEEVQPASRCPWDDDVSGSASSLVSLFPPFVDVLILYLSVRVSQPWDAFTSYCYSVIPSSITTLTSTTTIDLFLRIYLDTILYSVSLPVISVQRRVGAAPQACLTNDSTQQFSSSLGQPQPLRKSTSVPPTAPHQPE